MSTAQLRMTRKQPTFLTVPEVADMLRVKPATIYVWVSQRKIPFRKAGHLTLFDQDEILNWTKPEAKR